MDTSEINLNSAVSTVLKKDALTEVGAPDVSDHVLKSHS